MRVLLIGGGGFIGPHVAAALRREDHDVVVFRRTRTSPSDIVGDRNTLAEFRSAFADHAPDVVVDLILSSGGQARVLMDVFTGIARRVVALSSCDVYRACGVLHRSEDGRLQELPLTETSALRTKLQTYPPEQFRQLKGVFGWLDDEYDKIPVEREILGRADLPGTVLRLPMVYGPGDSLHRIGAILGKLDGRTTVTFEERYAAWRSPRGYVEDVGAAIALAATSERAAGRTYNVAEQDSLSELEWAKLVAAEIAWKGTFVTVPADQAAAELLSPGNLDQHWVVDSTKIRQELGYRERVQRGEAIRRSIAWEKNRALGALATG